MVVRKFKLCSSLNIFTVFIGLGIIIPQYFGTKREDRIKRVVGNVINVKSANKTIDYGRYIGEV